jgi:hypothetical protein
VCGVPFGSEALGFSNLGGGHQACKSVAIPDSVVALLPLTPWVLLRGKSCRREVVPHVRLHVVLRDAVTPFVHAPEEQLRTGVPLLRSQATVEALHIIVVENRIEELKVRVPTN